MERVGRMTVQKYHLLNQHTAIPSKNRMLLAYLLNCIQKHEVNRGVNAHVLSNPRSIDFIERAMQDKDKMKEIARGITNHEKPPKETMRLAKEFAGHLYFAGRDVGYGAVDRQKISSYSWEGARRFGPASGWMVRSLLTSYGKLAPWSQWALG